MVNWSTGQQNIDATSGSHGQSDGSCQSAAVAVSVCDQNIIRTTNSIKVMSTGRGSILARDEKTRSIIPSRDTPS